MTVRYEWTKGETDLKEIAKIEKYIANSKFLLDKAVQICYNSIIELESVSKSDYNTAGWAYEQAHRNGEVAALRKLIKIFSNN